MTPEQEAAELLPCQWSDTHEPCHDSWQCINCKQRPAVAERLRQRDAIIAKLDGLLTKHEAECTMAAHTREQRIAALDNDLKIARAGWEGNVDALRQACERIAVLEAELDKAADTFDDFERTFKLLRRTAVEEAARIAKEACRAALAGRT